MVRRYRPALILLRFFFFVLGLPELIHQSRKVELGVVFRALLGEHELVDFFDHFEVFLEDFAFIYDAFCDFAMDVLFLLHEVADFHLEELDIAVLLLKEFLERVSCLALLGLEWRWC